jgi:hypothetical protein
MFAVVAQRHNQDSREGMILLATARTLKAAQKKWMVINGQEADQIWRRRPPRYQYIAMLTPYGLVNFYGDKIAPSKVGCVAARFVHRS